MFLKHPLESQSRRDPKIPEYFPISDSAFQHSQLLNCHQPHSLFYEAPSEVVVGGKPIRIYRVAPYDEERVKRYHSEQARASEQSVHEVQRLLTLERSKFAKTPEIVQYTPVEVPTPAFDYSTSTRFIHEELQRDMVQPRLTVDMRDVDIAAIAGNDRIAIGGAAPKIDSDLDKMETELLGAFSTIAREAEEQRQREIAAAPPEELLSSENLYQAAPALFQPPYHPFPMQPVAADNFQEGLYYAPPDLPGGYMPQEVIEKSDYLIQQAEIAMAQGETEPEFGEVAELPIEAAGAPMAIEQPTVPGADIPASNQGPHLVSSNTTKSPGFTADKGNDSLEIECEMDDEVDRIITKSEEVCKNAANMIASTRQKLSDDIELEVASNDLGISSTSQSNVAPATTLPAALSEESGEPKPKPRPKSETEVQFTSQKKLSRKEQQTTNLREKPSSVKREPAVRPESVLHQINESKSNDDLNESAYIKGILAGNDSTLLDVDNSTLNITSPNSGRKSPLKQRIDKKIPAAAKKKKTAKKEKSMEISDDSFLRQLDSGKLKFDKQAYKDDFDDLALDDDDL